MIGPALRLHIRVRFHGELVAERTLVPGDVLAIGDDDDPSVPRPNGLPWVAHVSWNNVGFARIVDGERLAHRVNYGQRWTSKVGPCEVEATFAPRFALKRVQWVALPVSLVWLAVVLVADVTAGQMTQIADQQCAFARELAPVSRVAASIDERCQGAPAAGIPSMAYVVRLLNQDFDGQPQGLVLAEEFETATEGEPVAWSAYVPAGGKGTTAAAGEDRLQKEGSHRAAAADNERERPPKPDPAFAIEQSDPRVPTLDADEPQQASEIRAQTASEGVGMPDWVTQTILANEKEHLRRLRQLVGDVVALRPDDPLALHALGFAEYLWQDYDAALQTYDRLLEINPTDPATYNNKALVYKRLGDYAEEERLYRIALALDPAGATALSNLALNLAHQGRFDEAIAVLDRIDGVEDDAYVELHRAKVFAEMGERDRALEALERALSQVKHLYVDHQIEVRQDLKLDPSFESLRHDPAFRAILREHYGDPSPLLE